MIILRKIDIAPDTLIDLTDTPSVYKEGKFLQSTTSGTEWASVSGSGGTSFHSELYELAYSESGHTGFSPTVHNHTESNITDLDKYTQNEVDVLISSVSGTTDHSTLGNLSYNNSGHTGFQPSGNYLTDTEFSTYSGTLQSQIDNKSDTNHYHDDLYYTESEVDTISGSLQADIDGKSDTSHGHTASNISDFSEATDDRVNDLLVAGDNISLDYDDGAGTLTLSGTTAGISNHNELSGLQGGTVTEYYHLTTTQYADLTDGIIDGGVY